MPPITEQRWRADVPDWRNDGNVSPHPSDVQINEAEGWQTTVEIVMAEGLTWQEIEARANLIASAPELLAALKRAVECLDAFGWGVESDVARVAGLAAIAKATGGNPDGR